MRHETGPLDNAGDCRPAGPPARGGPVCEKPNMMIVQDRSGSMSGTKWTQAKNAIQFILNNYSGSLRFGLDMFPSNNDCGAGSIQVDLGDNMGTAIMAALNGTDANGMTPTAATLMVLNSYRPLKDIDRRNFVMLITDAPFHNGPDNYEPYTIISPEPPTYLEAVEALNDIHAKVLPICSEGSTAWMRATSSRGENGFVM